MKIQLYLLTIGCLLCSFTLQAQTMNIQTTTGTTSVKLSDIVNITFTDSDNETVTDIDGNTYRTVTIGNQVWMAENLKVTRYRNGEAIPNVTDNGSWSSLTTGAYCNYNNDVNQVSIYGRLYNWYAVNDGRNIAPAGWHVPSDDEWKQLEIYLGMSRAQVDGELLRGTDEGGKLKENGYAHWPSPNASATNTSGFTALPGGCRSSNAFYYFMGSSALFWSSTVGWTINEAWFRQLDGGSQIGRSRLHNNHGLSVRCVKD